MGLRYASVKDCERCGGPRPHTKRGQCVMCGKRQRRAVHKAKRSMIGSDGLGAWRALRTTADQLFSVWTRAKSAVCVVCRLPFPPEAMQAMHGISRESPAIRFDPDNVFPGCAACHRKHTPPGTAWEDWRLGHLGPERHARIARMDMARGKFKASDLRLVILDTQGKIAALPDGDRKAWALERQEAIMEGAAA